jgi:hypothetical protein
VLVNIHRTIYMELIKLVHNVVNAIIPCCEAINAGLLKEQIDLAGFFFVPPTLLCSIEFVCFFFFLLLWIFSYLFHFGVCSIYILYNAIPSTLFTMPARTKNV